LLTDDDRVARVVATLVADNEVGGLGKEVDDPTLPLVTPLGTQNDGGWHDVERR
jgi:hypothetical protein